MFGEERDFFFIGLLFENIDNMSIFFVKIFGDWGRFHLSKGLLKDAEENFDFEWEVDGVFDEGVGLKLGGGRLIHIVS